MSRKTNDNIRVLAPKPIDDREGVIEGGVWRPYNNVAEFYSLNPIELRYAGQEAKVLKSDGLIGSFSLSSDKTTLSEIKPALTKADVGLNLADNTPDLQKPVSTATQLAINLVNSGVIVAIASTAPVPNVNVYKASVAATYTNLGGVVVSAQDLLDGDVQILRDSTGVWSKKIIPVVGLSAYSTKTESASKTDIGLVASLIGSNRLSYNDVVANTVPIDNKYIHQNGGETSNISYAASDWISVLPLKNYRYVGAMFGTLQSISFYDSNKVFISSYVAGSGYTSEAPLYIYDFLTGSNVRFVRYSTYKVRAATASLIYTDLVDYYSSSPKLDKLDLIDGIEDAIEELPETYSKKLVVDELLAIESLVNPTIVNEAILSDNFFPTSTGGLTSNASFASTDYIPALASKLYRYDGAMFGTLQNMQFFDANKVFISAISAGSSYTSSSPLLTFDFTTPTSTAFIRSSTYKPRAAVPRMTYIDPIPFAESDRLNKIEEDIANFQSPIPNPRFTLPSIIYAVVGQELTIYYDAIALVIDKGEAGYSGIQIQSDCVIGRGYNNSFYRVTPTTAGDYQLTFRAFSYDKKIISEKTSILRVVSSSTFSTQKYSLWIGDSLTSPGITSEQVLIKLTAVGGINPIFLGTTNPGTTKVNEGHGGWTNTSFATAGVTYYTINVVGIGSISNNSEYSNNGSVFRVVEQNLTAGTGYLSLIRISGSTIPLVDGVLTKTNSVTGPTTINYTGMTTGPSNPLWNNGAIDIANYVQNVLGQPSGFKFDVVSIMLDINDLGQSPTSQLSDSQLLAIIETKKIIINAFLNYNPTTKVIVQLTPTCNNSGGGFPSEAMFRLYILNMWRMRELELLAFDNFAFNPRVYVGMAYGFIHRFYGYPWEAITVSTSKTININTNSVHPNTEGYTLIGKGVFHQHYALLK